MAHFASIHNGVVTQVIVVNNDAIDGGDFPHSEPLGQALLSDAGIDGKWLQCSFSGSFRGVFPAVGHTYDRNKDEFVAPDPPEPDPQAPPVPDPS